MRLTDWLPGRRKRRAEQLDAAHEAAITEQRERAAETDIRHAYAIAHKLAEHRRENHFAQRIQHAYHRRHA